MVPCLGARRCGAASAGGFQPNAPRPLGQPGDRGGECSCRPISRSRETPQTQTRPAAPRSGLRSRPRTAHRCLRRHGRVTNGSQLRSIGLGVGGPAELGRVTGGGRLPSQQSACDLRTEFGRPALDGYRDPDTAASAAGFTDGGSDLIDIEIVPHARSHTGGSAQTLQAAARCHQSSKGLAGTVRL